jgi:CheY-like chemotaxis protein
VDTTPALATAASAAASLMPAINPSSSLALNILLVDDAYPIQKILSSMLQRKGYQANVTENGLKAIRALAVPPNAEKDQAASSPHRRGLVQQDEFPKHYDVVLMDLQMPVMDGFEAIRSIRNYEMNFNPSHALHHQLIIAMSANSDEGTVQDALNEGADYFMVKPFHIETFQKIYEAYQTRSSS